MKSHCVSSGWYHHVWCILYTNIWSMICEIPESVSVACSPMFTSELLKGMGCDRARVLNNCSSFFWWGCEYWYLVDKLIPSTHMWLLYVLSLATDRPGLTVGHPVGAQAYFVSGFYYMVGLRLCVTLSVSVKMTSHLGSKVLYPYQLFLVPTHVVFITITILVFDRVIKRHASLLVLVLDHHSFSRNCVKWWCFCDRKGHGSAFSHSQTVRYSQIPSDYSKKRTFLGRKLLCWHWLCIRIML